MAQSKSKPAKAKLLSTDKNGFEYWQLGDEVYRCQVGNRGYLNTNGLPSGVRWECSLEHYKVYLAPGGRLGNQGKRGNPTSTWIPIATDLISMVADKFVLLFKLKGVHAKKEKQEGRQAPGYRVLVDKDDEWKANQVYSSVKYGATQSNPDSTPNDPREIAADLRILKAKQKLVRLEGGSTRNPSSPKLKQLKQDLKEHMAWMKAKGIKKISPFNGGLDREVQRANERRFELESKILKEKGLDNPDIYSKLPRAVTELIRLEGKQGNPDLSGTPKGYNWELVFVEWPTNTQRFERAHNFEVDSYEGAVKKAKWLAGASQDYSHIDNREFEFDIYNKGKLKGYCNWNLRGNSANIRFTRHKASKFENPSTLSSSQSLVETFHGRSHNSVDDIITFDSFPDSLAELGELRELVIISPRFKGELPIGFDESGNGVVKLASAPGGTQYVLVGGDQGIDPDSLVEDFGISEDELGEDWKRKVVLGEVVSLTYFTDKHHLSGPKYQKDGCLYEHELGEEGGELPTLVYDPNNESLEIVGGSYITKEEGIRN